VSKPPLEPNIGVGENRLILEIPDVWMFIPPVSGGAVKRIFPALILGPMEAFETTSKTWCQNLPSNPTSALGKNV
jgi:hypothetical protein